MHEPFTGEYLEVVLLLGFSLALYCGGWGGVGDQEKKNE
jgi:hypothetical protein